jgi:hypothetical protein
VRRIIVIAGVAVLTWLMLAVGSVASDAYKEQLEAEVAAVKADFRAYRRWVNQDLIPWAEDVADVVDEGAPGAPGTSPAPWASPIPTLAPLPSEVPTPSAEPSPNPPPSPSLLPSPSLCLPIVCEESPWPNDLNP